MWANQRKLEKVLGWRHGVIDDVMLDVKRKASTITMEELLLPVEEDPKGLATATNEELLEELRRRMA